MSLFKFFQKKNVRGIDYNNLPSHIGIIMDGNGRWAKKRGLPRNVGHRAGAQVLKNITLYCDKIGIKAITAYAFSTENWKRPQAEIDSLMQLLLEYLSNAERDLGGKNVIIKIIGDRTPLPDEMKEQIIATEKLTEKNTGTTLNIAINYGGRHEIVSAVRDIVNSKIPASEINEATIEQYLYTKDLPELDFIIRPSGEMRLSNFLLWQSAYAEFWFDNVLWPDFNVNYLNKAICEFQNRNRRYGGV